jgi:hypothetical protein
MSRGMWPAREERTADDKRHVATNRARREVRRCEMRQRAQDTANDQALERRQRRPARNNTTHAAHAKPKGKACDATTKEMLCRLTLELSGGGAVRLERFVMPHLTRRRSRGGCLRHSAY